MTLIHAAGKPLQPLIDAAAKFDTIDLDGKAYAGPVNDRSKALTFEGHGSSSIEGSSSDVLTLGAGAILHGVNVRGANGLAKSNVLVLGAGVVIEDGVIEDSRGAPGNRGSTGGFGIRMYHTDDLTVRRTRFAHNATHIEVNRGGGLLTEDVIFESADRMMYDDGTSATNGGQSVAIYYGNGKTNTILRGSSTGNRARTIGGSSWPWDGSFAEGYGSGILIVDGTVVRDSVNICEVGTSDPLIVPTGWVFKNMRVWGNPDLAPTFLSGRNCEGFYLRANKNFVISDNEFRDLDDYLINIVSGGQYGGTVGGNLVTRNKLWLKSGPSGTAYAQNAAYVIGSGMVPSTFGKIEDNTVYFVAAQNPAVGNMSGKGITNNLATWKTWTGYGTGETWGPEPPPADPCAQLEATLLLTQTELSVTKATLTATQNSLTATRAELAATQATLTATQTALDAAQTDLSATQSTLTSTTNLLTVAVAEKDAAIDARDAALTDLIDAQIDLATSQAYVADLEHQIADLTPVWTYGAAENKSFVLPGERLVRYGANGRYNSRILSGTVIANNATFGDPIKGTVKSASYTAV